MRNAHRALYACQEGYNIGHLPTPGNSKTVDRRGAAGGGTPIIVVPNGLGICLDGLASRLGAA